MPSSMDVPTMIVEHQETPSPYTLDGIKVTDERGWSQVLPDPDEPIVHIYAEGRTAEESRELAGELQALVQEIVQSDGVPAPAERVSTST